MTVQPSYQDKVVHKKTEPLSFIQPRETARAVKARGPRRFVQWLRVMLPIIAFLVIAALVAWPFINPNKLLSIAIESIPDLVIQNLHYTGLDANNQPYSISAEKATRPGGAQNIYDLDQPKGEIKLSSGSTVSGNAQVGRFDQDKRNLWLGGNVKLVNNEGYTFSSEEAIVDLKMHDAWGAKPVLIEGSFGEIRGQGFRLLDSGQIMVVKGPAKAILHLQKDEASDKPAGEQP